MYSIESLHVDSHVGVAPERVRREVTAECLRPVTHFESNSKMNVGSCRRRNDFLAELLLGAARHRGHGRAGRANADRQFCITYPASAPVVQVTQQGSGGREGGGEGEGNADAVCSRTVSASATLPSPLPVSQIGRDSLFHIERSP